MTPLQQKLDAVRSAWRTSRRLAGLMVVAADAVIVLLALAVLDTIYQFPSMARGSLLVAALCVVAVLAFWVIVRPLRRRPSDEQVALHVESRFPELQGTLLTAAEFEHLPRTGGMQGELLDALVVDCLERASKIDLAKAIDRRRLSRRGTVAGVLFIFLLGSAVGSRKFGHELARVLLPWKAATIEEQAQLAEKAQAEKQKNDYLAMLQAKEPEVTLTITPGNTQVGHGGTVTVSAQPSKVNGPLSLKYRASDGKWHTLAMTEDPADPSKYVQTLSDLTEDVAYQVSTTGKDSDIYGIKVLDDAKFKNLRLTYRYPAYTQLPAKTVNAADGSIEALEGTQVDVTLVAEGNLKEGKLSLSSTVHPTPLKITGGEAMATIAVTANDDYAITATDNAGNKIGPERRFTIKAIKDEPPKIEVMHPAIDSEVHPLEEIAFVAKASDDFGLKEVRLHTLYNSEPDRVQKISCTENGVPLTDKLAEFTLKLEDRPVVMTGDTVTFYMEAEDTKGQHVASDIYTLTVRPYEAWIFYNGPSHAGATHPPDDPELVSVIGAAWNLEQKRGTMTVQEFNTECEKIGQYLRAREKKHP